MTIPLNYLGNKELLTLPKTAFLASSTIPTDMVLKCYDWAAAKHKGCVVSGFSSKLEQDVLHFLIKAKCPVILVLARRMLKVLPGCDTYLTPVIPNDIKYHMGDELNDNE